MKIDRLILDPTGFVVLEFASDADRGEFIDTCVPGGVPYGAMRCSKGTCPPFRVSWNLIDLTGVTAIAHGNGTGLTT